MRKVTMVLILMVMSLFTYSQTDLVATFRSTSVDGFDNFEDWESDELLISFSKNKIKLWLESPVTIFLKDLVENNDVYSDNGIEYQSIIHESVDNDGDRCLVIMAFSGDHLYLYILYEKFIIRYYIPNKK